MDDNFGTGSLGAGPVRSAMTTTPGKPAALWEGRGRDHAEAIIAIGATISSYYSSQNRPAVPYWPLGFADTTLRVLGSDDLAPEVRAHAASELMAARSIHRSCF